MPLTLEQLRTVITRDQALQVIIDELEALGFNGTSWQSGSVQLTVLTGVAEVWRQVSLMVNAVSEMAFNATSAATALTTFSDSQYDNQRITSIATEGLIKLTGGAVGPPYVVNIGDLTAIDNVNGYTYRNITGDTIPVSGPVSLTFQAETPGAQGNVANNTIDELTTPLVGVTIDNPDPGPGTWITTLGIDVEADETLRTRNTSKWASLSYAAPAEAYVFFALTADSDVIRVTVDDTNPRGAGTIDVYIARAAGVAVGADVTTVQAFFDGRRPVTADPEAIAATAQSQALTATIHVTTALHDGAKEAEIEAAGTAYINSLDISGEVLPSGTQGYMIFSELIQAVSDVVGVRRVNFTTPAADVAITAYSVMTTGAITFTYIDID